MTRTKSLPAALAALERRGGTPASTSSDEAPPRFDAGSVLAGQELTWLEQLERARTFGRDQALTGLDNKALVAELGAQASRVAAATCRYLQLVAELVIRGVWADHGARTPAQWLSFEAGVGASTAGDHVRVGLRLRELDRVRAAFEARTISYTKVRAITRVAVPEVEELLLRWCALATGAEVERIVRAFRRSCAGEGSVPDGRRGLRTRFNGDGTTTVSITLLDEEAAELVACAERLVHLESDANGPTGASSAEDGAVAIEPAEASSAEDSVVADGPDGLSSAEDGDGPLWHHQRTAGARLADAIMHALTTAVDAGGVDTTGLDRHTLILQTAATALAHGETNEPDLQVPVTDPRGQVRTMSARVLRRIACEASRVMAVTRGDGTPLDLARRSRDPSVGQRRALLLRDRSCRFPGCGSTRHLHAHHVQFWSGEGPTNLANLVTLCGFHHRFVHDHDWRVEPAAAGTFRFGPPQGAALPTARPLEAADDAWWFDPGEGRPLRPVHRDGLHGPDLDAAVGILHQELRLATGTDIGLAA